MECDDTNFLRWKLYVPLYISVLILYTEAVALS